LGSGKKAKLEEGQNYLVEPLIEEVWQDFSEFEEEPDSGDGDKSENGRASAPTRDLPPGSRKASRQDIPPDPTSLQQWVGLYVREVVESSRSLKTAQAKRADLSRFVGFYLEVLGDRIDLWSPGLTASFLEELSRERSPQTRKRFQTSTLERVLATVRHFGRWVEKRGGLPGGDPCQGVKVPRGGPPVKQSRDLGEAEVSRLREAAVARCKHKEPAKLAWRDLAILELLIATGLRASEVGTLKISQVKLASGKADLVKVARRGGLVTPSIPLPKETAEALEVYFREARGRRSGWLFPTRRGGPLASRDVARGLERIQDRANQGRRMSERILVGPRELRRYVLGQRLLTEGPELAHELSGNVSKQGMERYLDR
jgi:integrase/recombinase XerD